MIHIPDQDQTRVWVTLVRQHLSELLFSVFLIMFPLLESGGQRCTSPKKGKKGNWAKPEQRGSSELFCDFCTFPPEGEVGRRTERWLPVEPHR